MNGFERLFLVIFLVGFYSFILNKILPYVKRDIGVEKYDFDVIFLSALISAVFSAIIFTFVFLVVLVFWWIGQGFVQ